MIDNFTPAGFPMHVTDWQGKLHMLVGWTLRDGHLLPVAVMEQTPTVPVVLDGKPAAYWRLVSSCSC